MWCCKLLAISAHSYNAFVEHSVLHIHSDFQLFRKENVVMAIKHAIFT